MARARILSRLVYVLERQRMNEKGSASAVSKEDIMVEEQDSRPVFFPQHRDGPSSTTG
jgi:hypothetical protein